ncbi:MAG: ParB/RepB/Spo0J family partition protein [Clostridia bacterium]|nr:ParB/RepB/Spo0J family partition protein [Clostridia bacterium]MBQ7861345.1 ParB/RepB/Spo0J family partition protein [Clostridia bacterium]
MNNNLKSPVNIPVERIRPFEGHPYKVLDNDEMNNLIDSIQQKGVISPIVVRPLENTDDEYEIISGHRRLRASVKAGLETVPALIYAVTRDEAAIMLVDSNLHREHILPSEKAFAYRLKMDAMNHQGQRTDLTCGQVGHKSRENVSETESGRQVQRYIRLTYLIPELLEMMDEDKIALSVGVELSFLDEQMQYDLLRVIEELDCTPSYSQAWHMHRDFNEGTLTIESMENTLASEKPNQKPMCKVPIEKLQKIAPKVKDKDFEDFVLKACEHYYKYLQRQRSRDRDAR